MQDQKSTFLSRNRVVLVGGVLLLLAAHLISSRVRQGTALARPQGFIMEALRPFQVAVSRTMWSASDLVQHYVALVNITRENKNLKSELARVQPIEARLHELELETRRLADLIDLKEALDLKVVGANVIGSDATGTARTIIIDRGQRNGLQPGMGVVALGGVVGKVVATSQDAARVLLLNDHNCALDALDQRSRARGIVSGVADDGVIMKYVERSEDVAPGDVLVTSGLDGVFPRGLLIGKVGGIERQGPGLFLNVAVTPAVDFHALEEVMAITDTPPRMADMGKN